MGSPIKRIVVQLEEVRENLLTYGDVIWRGIDPRQASVRTQGVAFYEAFVKKIEVFDRLSTEIEELISQHTGLSPDADTASAPITDTANERVIRDLDPQAPHTLDEDFEYIRPFGFSLRGRAYKDILTWRRLYEIFCQQLATMDGRKFARLADNSEVVLPRGRPLLSRDPVQFWHPLQITKEIYAEGTYSANTIRNNMKLLLSQFGIPTSEMKLYFRQDRDAGDS
jgi:hypothetical protein